VGLVAQIPQKGNTAYTLDTMHKHLQEAEEGTWYVRISDVVENRDIFDFRGDTPAIPASNQKLVTAVAALMTLGPAHRARTEVYATGPIEDGTLHGDLLFRGFGGVHFTGRYPRSATPKEKNDRLRLQAQRMIRALHDAGIRRVDGKITTDTTRWSDMVSNEHYPCAHGLSFNENTVDVHVVDSSIRSVPMAVSGFLVEPSGNASGQARRGKSDMILVNSSVDGYDYWRLEHNQPSDVYAHHIRRQLQLHGIMVMGQEQPAVAETAVGRLKSLSIEELIIPMGVYSDNFRAEMLYLTLGFEGFDSANYATGQAAILAGLQRIGFPLEGLVPADGSGLSYENRVSPGQLVYILNMLNESKYREILRRMLPVAGESGTLEKRFLEHRARNNLQAKTGTLKSVVSLSGFITTEQGNLLSFSMIANHVKDHDACWQTIERFADLMLDLRLE